MMQHVTQDCMGQLQILILPTFCNFILKTFHYLSYTVNKQPKTSATMPHAQITSRFVIEPQITNLQCSRVTKL